MASRSNLLLLILFCASQSGAQVASTAQTFTVQVSTAQVWTDSGLDLQAGDVLELSAAASSDQLAASGAPACDPNGVTAAASPATLPLPNTTAGALMARLHAHGAAPVLVGSFREFHIAEPSHLSLGMNIAGVAPCQGTITVTVHVIPAGLNSATTSSTSTSAGTNGAQPIDRGQQLKSQLATAAQVFMSGQFGMGKSEAGASNAASAGAASGADAATAAPLKLSDAPLDGQLRKGIDSLPRRVNDQFGNPGDMVNFVIVGSQKDVQAALAAANWHVADTDKTKAVLNALEQTYDSKDYLAMPMSALYLFGRKQDFGYEMAEPIAMVASRHHFRIWKAPFTWRGSEVWCGAGTHDIGFAKDKRNGSVTHKIDPSVDSERDNIGSSLQKANPVKTLTYYLPPDPVQAAKNATGDGYHSDGRLLVIFLQ
ncbi:MAG TPA: LssY C-terminal domain-containing protein [Candidatus Sulfotelmatobacter sp.]|nr:LssY C-terminal domain-containing protein [Candidatus Sulfotelmatobacter sp.]